MKKKLIALTGNPNSGKSTLFNQLTKGNRVRFLNASVHTPDLKNLQFQRSPATLTGASPVPFCWAPTELLGQNRLSAASYSGTTPGDCALLVL